MAQIGEIDFFLPSRSLNNDEIAKKFPDWSAEKIAKKTGIKTRHISGENEFVSDLAVSAGEKFFKANDVNRDDIDFILLCTQSPDYPFPATACIIQERLKIPKSAGALDYNLGCSGYIYGLAIARSLVDTGISRNLLLITSETITKYIGEDDKGNQTLFGDAAAVTLVTESEHPSIGPFVFGTNGGGMNSIIAKKDLRGHQFSEIPYNKRTGTLSMNGPEVFQFSLSVVPTLVKDVLHKAGLDNSDINYFVFHQANAYMLTQIRKRLGIEKERFLIDMADVGNTVASSIPIVLKNMRSRDQLKPGTRVLLAGFGVGLSWGACIVEF
ncbi:ketoacyl-ACP synthase III [Flavobacteriales bacterium]|nr:ketoacyl-ACP synthase III [Flavobacteriales bacterium]